MARKVKRPKLAPMRKLEPVWEEVPLDGWEGWWFSFIPSASMEMLESLMFPLAKLEKLAPGQGDINVIEALEKHLTGLCESLSQFLLDWNFRDVRESARLGEDVALPNPHGNVDVIKGLDLSVLIAIGALISTYMGGTPPNASRTSSENEAEEVQETEKEA